MHLYETEDESGRAIHALMDERPSTYINHSMVADDGTGMLFVNLYSIQTIIKPADGLPLDEPKRGTATVPLDFRVLDPAFKMVMTEDGARRLAENILKHIDKLKLLNERESQADDGGS